MNQETFDGAGLEQALKSGATSAPAVELIGMVKASKKGHVSFTRQGCDHWVDIPTDLIGQATQIGQARCKDHTHPVFRLILNESTDPLAKVLAALLAHSAPAHPAVRTGASRQASELGLPIGGDDAFFEGARSSSLNALNARAAPGQFGQPSVEPFGEPHANPSSARQWAGGFGNFGGVGGVGGLGAWGCWDSCCETRCAAGHWVRNYALGRWVWVCDWWVCTDPCERCIWPW